ncbi:MAG TPA: hypothetical protein VNZ58_03925 [Thermomicrobiales bacterium]|nr:hypothetical protein [Thermomicrobiales bacterium]
MPDTLTNNNVRGNPYRIRDPHNSSLLEIWLVSAVVTVLGIRLYLYLTGYPQVGGDTLHIAHMLWGGLGMVIAFGFLLLFASSIWKPIAALVGGIGFGAFIDELGKFITKDNDYFFEPTIAIMYAVFIVLYFSARYFDRKRTPTEADHLYFAAQGVAWQAIGKLDKRRQEEALANLDASGNSSDVAVRLRDLLENAELVEESEQSRILSMRDRAAAMYWRVVRQRWLLPIVIGLFIVRALEIIVTLVIGIFVTGEYNLGDGVSVFEWLSFAAGAVTGFLAVFGLVMIMRRHRVRALQAFAASTVVALFFGQFFAFATEQFVAMVGLIANLIILGILRLALSVENDRFVEEGDREGDEDPRAGIGKFL